MPQTLRVMAYNILYGGTTGGHVGAAGGSDRTALLTAQVNAIRPDALALSECWGFLDDGAARMEAFCEAVGMRGALVEAATGNHVALLYREPWSPASTATVAAPMHHGLVRMELTNGDCTVQVIATHLNPFSSLMRLQEAQVVVSRTRPGEHTLVMGDLNTLPVGYDAPLQARRLLDEELRPDTHVCEYFAGAGFVDVLAEFGVPSPTYPTPLERKRDDFLGGVRLDYIMASEGLASACTGAWVIDTPEAGMASDHLPVVAEFTLEG